MGRRWSGFVRGVDLMDKAHTGLAFLVMGILIVLAVLYGLVQLLVSGLG